MPDDRENITLQVGGKSFTIDAPSGLSDEDVIRKAIRADSEFAGLARTHPKLAGLAAQEQAHAQVQAAMPKALIPGTDQPDPTGLSPEEKQAKLNDYMRQSGNIAAETAGGMAMAPAVAAATRGLPWIARYLGTAAGAGVGVGAGHLAANPTDPQGAGEAGLGATAGALVLDPAIKATGAFFKPFLSRGTAPAMDATLLAGIDSRSRDLVHMADAEEGLRRTITAAPRAIRKNVIAPLYPQVDTPVDIYAPAKTAVTETGQQIAHGTPSELLRTKAIGRQIEQIEGTLRELVNQDHSLASDPMQQAELLDTLQALKDRREIPFARAQSLRSALGQAIAKGQGYKLPAEVFHSLSNVREALDDAMRSAADQSGVLSQWQTAQKVHSQFMNDFYNKNAPLKGVLDMREGMTGATLKKLTRPEVALRAESALRRWGMNDAADALRRVMDTPDSTTAIKDMQQAMTSPKNFQASQLAAAKAADQARVEAFGKAQSQARGKRWAAIGTAGGVGSAIYGGKKLLDLLKNVTP